MKKVLNLKIGDILKNVSEFADNAFYIIGVAVTFGFAANFFFWLVYQIAKYYEHTRLQSLLEQ